jgi:hypothetical protein
MFTNWRLFSCVSIASILATGSTGAQTATVTPEQIEKLEAQILALEREVQNLKKKAASAERSEKTKKADRTEAWETSITGPYTAQLQTSETYTAEPARRASIKQVQEDTFRAPEEREDERSAAKPARTETPVAGIVTFRGGRPTIASSDGRMSLAIGELFQYDVGSYFQNQHSGVFEPPGARELNDGENLRRGRIYFVATFDKWTARITPDFGGFPDGTPTLFEANLSYDIEPVTFTIGYFKPFDTLARSQFPGDALFMERPSIASPVTLLTESSAPQSGSKHRPRTTSSPRILPARPSARKLQYSSMTRRPVVRCGLPLVPCVARIGICTWDSRVRKFSTSTTATFSRAAQGQAFGSATSQSCGST